MAATGVKNKKSSQTRHREVKEGQGFVPVLFGARAVVASAVPVSMERMALRKEPVRLTA